MARFSSLLVLALVFPATLFAQDQPDPWQAKKEARFKPVSAEHRELISAAVPKNAAVKPKKERRVLVFYRCEGFIHGSIPHGNVAAQLLGEKTGVFTVDLADTYDVFTNENLAKYDCILLNSTTHMHFPKPAQLNAFLDFITTGKGLAGFHAASDNFGTHPEARSMVGGIFSGHPWGAGGTWAFKLDDPSHVLNKAFDGSGFWYQDEIYQYNPKTYAGPEKLRILVSLDMTKKAVSGRINDAPREVPVSWIRKAGEGRVFISNFGHRPETFQNPAIMKHMLDGIQYAIGDLEADDSPTGKSSSLKPALAQNRNAENNLP